MPKLSTMTLKNLKPRGKRYEVGDGAGLSIRVSPSGRKSWIYRHHFNGWPKRLTLGRYPAVGLSEARKRAATAAMDVERGIDPGAKKAAEKRLPTFRDLLDEFWAHELSKTPSGSERLRMIEKDAAPAWGSQRAADITRRDAVLLLDKVRHRAPVGGNRLQGVLTRCFNFGCERGLLDVNPMAGLRRPKERARSRVLSNGEIRVLWEILDREQIANYAGVPLALKLVLLTGQRPGEVAAMRWDQIEERWWQNPISKTGAVNRVYLTDTALDVLDKARVLGDGPWVFPSPRADNHLIGHALANAVRRYRRSQGIEPFSPHDLRRTVRTRLAALEVDDVVAEKVLGHKLQGVLGIYNRYTYDQEKKRALALWERHLGEIVGITEPLSSNIIHLEIANAKTNRR